MIAERIANTQITHQNGLPTPPGIELKKTFAVGESSVYQAGRRREGEEQLTLYRSAASDELGTLTQVAQQQAGRDEGKVGETDGSLAELSEAVREEGMVNNDEEKERRRSTYLAKRASTPVIDKMTPLSKS